jgi:hypothetical protein
MAGGRLGSYWKMKTSVMLETSRAVKFQSLL